MNFPAINGINPIQPGQTPMLDQINPLRNIGGTPAAPNVTETEESFGTLFEAYMNIVNEAGRMEMQSQQLQVGFALGQHDDMMSVVLAQEAAYTSLYFTVQVTNRIIEAYREIMRMQI